MATATVTSKGQTTIPKSIREYLRLAAGDQLDFIIGADGRVTLMPRRGDIMKLRGFFGPPPRRRSLEEMDEAIRAAAVERHRKR